MNSKKMLALVGKGVKETERFGKMIPKLDGENYDPQLIVFSGLFQDIQYLVRSEVSALYLYVLKNDGVWRGVPASSYDSIGYEGFRDEYKVIERIVRDVNENYGGENW